MEYYWSSRKSIFKFVVEYVLTIAAVALAILPNIQASFFQGNEGPIGVAIVSLCVFQIIMVILLAGASKQVRLASIDKVDHDRFVEGVRNADSVFRRLADRRSKFDRDSLSARNQQLYLDDERLVTVLKEYLEELCNGAVEIIAYRMAVPRSDLSAFVSLVERFKGDNCLVVASSSSSFDEDRAKFFVRRGPISVSKHAFLSDLQHSGRDCLPVPSLMDYLEQDSHSEWAYPVLADHHYMISGLVVPIKSSPRGDDFHSKAINLDGSICGVMQIDSNDTNIRFDNKFVIDIMREMSIHAFSAIHMTEILRTKNNRDPSGR